MDLRQVDQTEAEDVAFICYYRIFFGLQNVERA